MPVTNFPDGVNVGDSAGATALFQLGGTAVNVTAAELNAIAGGGLSSTELGLLDGALAGTVVASKAVAVDANLTIDGITITAGTITTGTVTTLNVGGTADISTLELANTAVTSTAAELNKLDGVLGNVLAYDNAGFRILASGSTAITGSGTIASGMADVQHVVASLANVGTAAGDAFAVFADPSVGGGSIAFSCFQDDASAASNAGTVNWIAVGTAA